MHCQLHFWRTYICRNNYNVSQHNIIKVYFFDLQNRFFVNYLCIFDTTEYSMKLNFYFYLQTLEFKIKRIMFMELFIKINLGTFFFIVFLRVFSTLYVKIHAYYFIWNHSGDEFWCLPTFSASYLPVRRCWWWYTVCFHYITI